VAQHTDDPALQVELARAYGRVGAITSEIGSQELALEAFQQELALWSDLAADSPGDGDRQYGLAASHHHIGVLQRQLGRSAEALASYDRAMVIKERIAVEYPELPIQQELGQTLMNRGNVLTDLGRLVEARESYRRAPAVYRSFRRRSAKRPPRRRSGAGCRGGGRGPGRPGRGSRYSKAPGRRRGRRPSGSRSSG
jgi:tetratricopeptide (TPR) repeat protein